jgi:hypothetical protein
VHAASITNAPGSIKTDAAGKARMAELDPRSRFDAPARGGTAQESRRIDNAGGWRPSTIAQSAEPCQTGDSLTLMCAGAAPR